MIEVCLTDVSDEAIVRVVTAVTLLQKCLSNGQVCVTCCYTVISVPISRANLMRQFYLLLHCDRSVYLTDVSDEESVRAVTRSVYLTDVSAETIVRAVTLLQKCLSHGRICVTCCYTVISELTSWADLMRQLYVLLLLLHCDRRVYLKDVSDETVVRAVTLALGRICVTCCYTVNQYLPHGRICRDNCTRCYSEKEVPDQTC